MKKSFLDMLVDPKSQQPLILDVEEQRGEEIISGSLTSKHGEKYPIIFGIPRFIRVVDQGQKQTSDAFSFKWKKRESYDSPNAQVNYEKWLTEKYGFRNAQEWAMYFNSKKRILDLGCGSGSASLIFLNDPLWEGKADWIGADISDAVDIAAERLSHIPNTHFLQADAMNLPFPYASFDVIFSEGVLHHTPSVKTALKTAALFLEKGGELLFYVYRRKGPIREFTDDYIRERISILSDEAAWEMMHSITALGQALFNIKTTVKLEIDVPLLGIQAGEHDVQRLIYWNFAKLYWNPALSFEENTHINFDWYRPQYAHRQTEEEVRLWCDESQLTIQHFHVQESGFTVRALKL